MLPYVTIFLQFTASIALEIFIGALGAGIFYLFLMSIYKLVRLSSKK
jgi:hypothetical protein